MYEDYAHRVEKAGNEATIVVETSELLKKYPTSYPRAYNRTFTNLPRNVGFNDGLSAPQPDFVEGLEKEDYLPFPVDDHIDGAALYQDDPYSITLPQIAGEWKGPTGDMREAKMQSAYDGAAMVHARTQALAHMGKSDPSGHASITTFTTDGANLYQYAHYAAPSDKDPDTLEYHQFPISSMNLTGTYQELGDQLREYWEQQRDSLHPIAEGVPTLPVPGTEPLDTYENEDDYEVAPPSTHSSTHGSAQKRKAPSSQGSSSGSSHHSKYRSYWKKDAMSGRYYHEHSDGTVSWLDDEEDERAQTYGQEDTVRPGGDSTWMAPVTRCLKRVTGRTTSVRVWA
ncbi:hypothetical protein B0T17DRAFT_603919 [Bombardia bombarda]|uniref:Uncharacterized protein n=1 Tax=Bombardia bombarda TaxID=252184 RepID=A0AA40CEG2_9PEZI|nr:hypothetical protein B0T17DRAFT_603919 [Bombardia bombarda]